MKKIDDDEELHRDLVKEAAEEELKWDKTQENAVSLEDFNMILLRKIYTTYNVNECDEAIKKWKDTGVTESIKEKAPDKYVWEDAKELAEVEGALKRDDSNALGADLSTRRNIEKDGRYNSDAERYENTDYKKLESQKIKEEAKSAEMSFSEPPNIEFGSELETKQDPAKAKDLKNIGIKGQINPKFEGKEALDEVFLDNIEHETPADEFDLKEPENIPEKVEKVDKVEKAVENKEEQILDIEDKNEAAKIQTQEIDKEIDNDQKDPLPSDEELPGVVKEEKKGAKKETKKKGKKGTKKTAGKSGRNLSMEKPKKSQVGAKSKPQNSKNPEQPTSVSPRKDSPITPKSKRTSNLSPGRNTDKQWNRKTVGQLPKKGKKNEVEVIEEDANPFPAQVAASGEMQKSFKGKDLKKQEIKVGSKDPEISADNGLGNEPRVTSMKKKAVQLTAASGISAVEIETPVKIKGNYVDERKEEIKKTGVNEAESQNQAVTKWAEKSSNLKEQVFDLVDLFDKKTQEISMKKRKRKLRSQMIKKLESPIKPREENYDQEDPPAVRSDKEPDLDRSDSGVIEGDQVAFDGNFKYDRDNLSEGGANGPMTAEDEMIYYPKDDLTNYSKDRGLNKMLTRHLDNEDTDRHQSDADLFAQIEQSLLQQYGTGRNYESDQENDQPIFEKMKKAESVIIEDQKAENYEDEEAKSKIVGQRKKLGVRPRTKKRVPPKARMTQTARQFTNPTIKRNLTLSSRKKPKKTPTKRVVYNQPKKNPELDSKSPYSELLFKRYKEYQPTEAVKLIEIIIRPISTTRGQKKKEGN